MKVLQDIMPYLEKLPFQDSDTSKISDMEMKNYMNLVRDTSELPNQFVPMQWKSKLE